MDSDNWVVSNLQGALDTWNEKMGEIVGLLTASPADFRGGGIWDAVLSIHGAVQAVALALLVLFFLSGLVKTCGSFAEAKRPEVVLKLFVRFVLAHAAVVYGLELMMAFLDVVQGLIGDMLALRRPRPPRCLARWWRPSRTWASSTPYPCGR